MGGDSLRIVRNLLASYRFPSRESDDTCGRVSSEFSKLLRRADVPSRWCYTVVLVVGCLSVVVAMWKGLVAGAVCVLGGLGMAYLRLHRRASLRRQAIDRDLPALLTSVASSVRAGIDPLSALVEAREYLAPKTVLADEVEKVRQGLASGQDEEEILEGFLELYQHNDGELFKRCLILSRRHGGSLAESLHRVTRVVRQRQSFRRKTRAALAMHRMSAVGIAVCAIVIGGIQFGTNAQGVGVALSHPVGSKLLFAASGLLCVGLGWMMTMGSEAKRQ